MIFGDFGDVSAEVSFDTNAPELEPGQHIPYTDWVKDPFVQLINKTVPDILTGRLVNADDVKRIFDEIKKSAIAFGLASKNDYNSQLALQKYAINLTNGMAQSRHTDQPSQDAFVNAWLSHVFAQLSTVAAIPKLIINPNIGIGGKVKVQPQVQPQVRSTPAPIATQAKPAGVPTWVYIAGGAAVLGIAGYFMMHKK